MTQKQLSTLLHVQSDCNITAIDLMRSSCGVSAVAEKQLQQAVTAMMSQMSVTCQDLGSAMYIPE